MKDQSNQKIFLRPAIPRYAGYCDCFLSTPVFFRIENKGAENAVVKVKSGENELFLPFEGEAEIPFESEAALRADGLFSPRFLAENQGKKRPPRAKRGLPRFPSTIGRDWTGSRKRSPASCVPARILLRAL